VVRYNFPQPDPELWISAFDIDMAKVDALRENDTLGRAAAVDDAVIAVLAVWLLAHEDEPDAQVDQRLPGFMAHVYEVLDARRIELAGWFATIEMALWQRDRNGWCQVCLGRSAIEVLVTGHPEDPLLTADLVAGLDEEMRQIGPGLNALPPDVIPRGIPASHWWWTLPQGPDEDDTDYSY
jgi:hypothetical protein